MGAGSDLVTSTFLGLPSYSLLKPFMEGLKDWKTRVELKQLAYFLKEFENLTQSERIDFSLMIQANEKDFAERLFYYITQLNDKRKARICGKIGVAYARKNIPEKYFLMLISIIQRCQFDDLSIFFELKENNTALSVLKVFPDKIVGFQAPTFFHYSLDRKKLIGKNNLKSLNLINSVLTLNKVRIKSKNPSLEEIRKGLNNLEEKEKFTELAYYMYEFALKDYKT